MNSDFFFMECALKLAKDAIQHREVPVGAVVVYGGQIIGRGHNLCIQQQDPTAHAEIVALRQAAQTLKSYRLDQCAIYVTLEPCAMCAGAIAHARIQRLIFGAYDPKGGGVDHGARVFDHPTCHHRPHVIGGVLEQGCGHILQDFFQNARRSQ